jgi:hypothetical protein
MEQELRVTVFSTKHYDQDFLTAANAAGIVTPMLFTC